ncbi:hypothetical protein [Mucilaginibacter psychrotolerans]|uniref:Carboxypeptidase regulatory-like domain-containing protein n=1 Tax=Mucilaginibacter psychrotolerans TaxID=1524096 RepID=A0A4Y8SC92_9SPHI|nr:hypothetical protein [Mucilaginibacter psychrotolerans]TFF36281.1 hypothetical protein E2R66_15705 [Mucilaginibacter psychrotolerans]
MLKTVNFLNTIKAAFWAVFCLCTIFGSTAVFAQSAKSTDTTGTLNQVEKLYLQLDRPHYTTFDTIWFKANLFNAATYTPSRLSSKIYIELINDSSKVVNRFTIPLVSGLGLGHIALNEAISDGLYTIRAYSNWMQNFGSEVFFSKQFYVGKPTTQGGWLVNEQHTITQTAKSNEVNLALQLSTLARAIIPYRDIEIKLTEGKKTLFKNNFLTSDGGKTTANFILPAKADTRKLELIITDKTTKNRYHFPFYPGGPMQSIDLQFMPEGGQLVAGLASRVAFKAIGEDGLAVDIKGTIVDSHGSEVSAFTSKHKGMGVFMLVPVANETYSAKYQVNGIAHTAMLPLVAPVGLTLRVDNLSIPDSILISVRATAGLAAQNKLYKLMVQSATETYAAVPFNLNKGYCNIHSPRDGLSSGIISFTILDDAGMPLCQRRVFIDNHDRLNLDVTSSQPIHQPKDSVSITLNSCDTQGAPIIGSFAVSVTDDAYINSKAGTDNIISHLLLTSELKGYVEDAAWYFTATDDGKAAAMDNLMLAQGWAAYDWVSMLPSTKPIKYSAEPDNNLTGNLRALFNKPAKDAKLNLFSVSKKHGLVLYDTVSNAQGEFTFRNLPVFDTITYTLRVNNKKDKASTADIHLNTFTSAKIEDSPIRPMPWFVHLTDSLMLGYFNRPQPERVPGIDMKEVKGKLLKEVQIKERKPNVSAGGMTGSLVKEITEVELVEAGKMSLYDLLSRKLKGFGLGFLYKVSLFGKPTMHDQPALVKGMDMIYDIIVDGIGSNVMTVGSPSTTDIPIGDPQSMIDLMRYLGADDVKDIKIADGMRTFITVTTRSGNSYFTRISPNVVTYRPIPYCLPRQFYRPRYTVNSTTPVEPRPTIHWEPNLITDKDGKATLSFYAADKPGTYTVTIEGTDMNGNFGYQTSKVVISKPARADKTNFGK